MDDPDWDNLSPEEQDRYNNRIDAENELIMAKEKYYTSMSFLGPLLLGIFGLMSGAIFFPALLILALAVVWALIRVGGRSQAYQRYKDAKDTFESLGQ